MKVGLLRLSNQQDMDNEVKKEREIKITLFSKLIKIKNFAITRNTEVRNGGQSEGRRKAVTLATSMGH